MRLYPLYSNQVLLTSSSPTFAGLTLTGNLIIPDAGYIGSVSATTALQIEADGDILIAGQLGVGVTPGAQVEIAKAAANATLILSCYHDTEATTPLITMRKADNTLASPALIDDNAVLGTILFQGYDGSGWESGAKIEARAQGDASDGTDMPTELTFWTTPEASATMVERMTIDETGYVGIGTVGAKPEGLLHVYKGSAGAVSHGYTDLIIESDGAASIHIISPDAGSGLIAFGSPSALLGAYIQYTYSSGSSVLNFSTQGSVNCDMIFRPGDAAELVRFAGTGEVGIMCPNPAGTLSIGNVTEGKTASLNVKTAHETHTLTLGASSVTTGLDIPTTALVLGAAFCVNTAVTDSTGDDTWSAAFSGGDASAIVAAVAPAQNTKAHSTVVPALTNAETEITFTPQGGNFTAGVIEVVAWYIDLTDLANV